MIVGVRVVSVVFESRGCLFEVALPKVREVQSAHSQIRAVAKLSGRVYPRPEVRVETAECDSRLRYQTHHQRIVVNLGRCCCCDLRAEEHFLEYYLSPHLQSRVTSSTMAAAGATWAQVRQQARAAETQVGGDRSFT